MMGLLGIVAELETVVDIEQPVVEQLAIGQPAIEQPASAPASGACAHQLPSSH